MPAIEEVARAAGVSRATAYRYFPSQDLLLAEATLETATPGIERLLSSPGFPAQAEERLDHLVNAVYEMLFRNEAVFRAMLRLSLDPSHQGAIARGARRVAWLETALAPIRDQFAPADFKRLVTTLAVFFGIEGLIVFEDVCGLSRRSAQQSARWAVQTILQASMAARVQRKGSSRTRSAGKTG